MVAYLNQKFYGSYHPFLGIISLKMVYHFYKIIKNMKKIYSLFGILFFGISLHAQVSLIGLATPYNDNVSDFDMIENPIGSGKWTASVFLTATTVKFRVNHSNTTTFGGTVLPSGTASTGGPDFNLTVAAFYVVHFNAINKQYSFFADGKVGINNNTPKTALDVAGAITIRPVYLSVAGNALIIPDNVGNVVINQVGPTAAFTINIASYAEGQRLIIDNLSPHVGTLAGTIDVPAAGISEFVVSDGEWKLITNNPATPSNSWKTVGNAGINATTNFLGTTDAQPLSFKINNAEKMKLVTGGLQFNQSNFLEFGLGYSKETNAGKIGYALFTPQTLDIVGAGTQFDNRKIRFWAEGGSTFEGAASFAKGVGISANATDGKLQINSSTASIASIAIKDSMTNGAGHISFRNVNNDLHGMDIKVNSTGSAGNLNNLSLNTAVNIYDPSQTFYGNGHTTIRGNLTIADDTNTPVAGTMRYNSTLSDFEGYNGTEWKSLTKVAGGWGVNTNTIEANFSFSQNTSKSKIKGNYAIAAGLGIADTIYFYEKSGTNWNVTTKIPIATISTSTIVNISVAINNDYAVVGTTSTISPYGRVYIFKRVASNWIANGFINNPDLFSSRFGFSVALSVTNTLVVGAPKYSNFITDLGAIYVFKLIGLSFILQQTINGDFVLPSAQVRNMGYDVAVDGNYIIVGAPGILATSQKRGVAIVLYFNGSTWVLDTILYPSTSILDYFDDFAIAVDVSNDLFIASGSLASRIWKRTGASYAVDYIFPDDVGGQKFCAISNNRCAIIANKEGINEILMVYEKTTIWKPIAIADYETFRNVSLDGNNIITTITTYFSEHFVKFFTK
jgi:hypothetical protein